MTALTRMALIFHRWLCPLFPFASIREIRVSNFFSFAVMNMPFFQVHGRFRRVTNIQVHGSNARLFSER
jgi:hypothetical protein